MTFPLLGSSSGAWAVGRTRGLRGRLQSHPRAQRRRMLQGSADRLRAGNFLFWSKNRHDVGWYCGALISLSVGRHGIAEAEFIPYRQCRSAPELEPMTEADRIVFEEHLAALSEVITDPADLQTVWLEFCRTLRPAYLRYALGLSNKERRLVSERGRWPERRLPRARIPDLLNLYRCETHLDVITSLLEEEPAIEPPVPPRAG